MSFTTHTLQPIAGRRMVLCWPCGDGDLLAQLAALPVQAVGLDADLVRVLRCRERGLIAWAGTWHVLAAQRQKFDGIAVDLAALATQTDAQAQPALLRTLAATLLPGGILLVLGGDADSLAADVPAELAVHASHTDSVVFAKARRPVPAPSMPHVVVGPYADAFVGCERVLEIGCGAGRFLDALHVRDVAHFGFEQDPDQYASCRQRSTMAACGGLELVQRHQGFDGVHVGNVVEEVAADALPLLLAACRRALRPQGRLLVRARRGHPVLAALRERMPHHGFPVCHAGSAPFDHADALLLALADAMPAGATALPDALDDVALPTASLPINRPPSSLFDLERCERRLFSQGGEDGILEAIFDLIGTSDRRYVEFGCGDGVQCNSAALRKRGWQGVLMDGVAAPGEAGVVIHAAWITAENIEALLDRHAVPAESDLMSIDLDGNDFWVWRAITRRPRVVVAEYNANLGCDEALTIPYDPEHRWDGTDFYGASLPALAQLGRAKGYTLVYCNQAGVNAFFVRDDLVPAGPRRSVQEIYRPPNYWYRGARQVPNLARAMVAVAVAAT